MGILDSFKKIVGNQDSYEALLLDNDKQLKIYMQNVEKINALEEKYEQYSNEELRNKTEEFRMKLLSNEGITLDTLLVDAFAVVREASWRVLQLRHFDVQVDHHIYVYIILFIYVYVYIIYPFILILYTYYSILLC